MSPGPRNRSRRGEAPGSDTTCSPYPIAVLHERIIVRRASCATKRRSQNQRRHIKKRFRYWRALDHRYTMFHIYELNFLFTNYLVNVISSLSNVPVCRLPGAGAVGEDRVNLLLKALHLSRSLRECVEQVTDRLVTLAPVRSAVWPATWPAIGLAGDWIVPSMGCQQ